MKRFQDAPVFVTESLNIQLSGGQVRSVMILGHGARVVVFLGDLAKRGGGRLVVAPNFVAETCARERRRRKRLYSISVIPRSERHGETC